MGHYTMQSKGAQHRSKSSAPLAPLAPTLTSFICMWLRMCLDKQCPSAKFSFDHEWSHTGPYTSPRYPWIKKPCPNASCITTTGLYLPGRPVQYSSPPCLRSIAEAPAERLNIPSGIFGIMHLLAEGQGGRMVLPFPEARPA